jgi:hypothetical protein
VLHDWFFNGVSPRIYSNTWATFLQWGASNGMEGIYTEWSPGQGWYIDGANYWVQRQLLTDPYQSADGLWREYCTDMYGPAGETMQAFYNVMAQKQLYVERYCVPADMPRYDFAAYLPDEMASMRRLLDKAVAATRDDAKIQKRLDAVARYFKSFEMLNAVAGEPYRDYFQHTYVEKRQDINDKALAYYVNHDPAKMAQALEFYDNKRTIPPDADINGKTLGAEGTLRNTYAAALGTILQAVQTQSLKDVDTSKPDAKVIAQLQAAAGKVIDAHLPAKYNPEQAQAIKAMAGKFLWIPKADELPVIDGDLSDKVWQQGTVLDDFTVADILIASPAGNAAAGRIMRVGDQLLIGLTLQQPKGIWARTTPDIHTGTRIWRESGVEIFLGYAGDARHSAPKIQYIVNALGAYRGFGLAADNRQDVAAAAKVAADGKSYTIEVSLPLKVAGKYDLTEPRALSFNIMRDVYYGQSYGTDECMGWYPIFFTAQWPESRAVTFMAQK